MVMIMVVVMLLLQLTLKESNSSSSNNSSNNKNQKKINILLNLESSFFLSFHLFIRALPSFLSLLLFFSTPLYFTLFLSFSFISLLSSFTARTPVETRERETEREGRR